MYKHSRREMAESIDALSYALIDDSSLSSEMMERNVRDNLVSIIRLDENNTIKHQGTGLRITTDFIITAYHVLSERKKMTSALKRKYPSDESSKRNLFVRDDKGKQYGIDFSCCAYDKDNDLALIKISGIEYIQPISYRLEDPFRGDKVCMIGRQFDDDFKGCKDYLNAFSINSEDQGEVLTLNHNIRNGFLRTRQTLLTSVPVEHGHSGGLFLKTDDHALGKGDNSGYYVAISGIVQYGSGQAMCCYPLSGGIPISVAASFVKNSRDLLAARYFHSKH